MKISKACPFSQISPDSYLIEDSGLKSDDSCAYMSPKGMERLQINSGELIRLYYPKGRH